MNLDNLFPDCMELTRIVVITIIAVLLAIFIDLCCGLVKAKTRGEIRSSWGLKRTANKVATYVGVLLILAFVDYLIHFCHFYSLFGWHDAVGIPFLTCFGGIFFLVVEVISMFEHADKKTKTEITRGSQILGSVVKKEEIIDAIASSLVKNLKIKDKTTISESISESLNINTN